MAYATEKGAMAEAKTKLSDTEKITINLGLIDLGQIDLLVQEGFYTNRTDLIRTAIRNQLATQCCVRPSRGARWYLACRNFPDAISRRCANQGRSCASRCWGSFELPTMSLRNWRAKLSNQLPC